MLRRLSLRHFRLLMKKESGTNQSFRGVSSLEEKAQYMDNWERLKPHRELLEEESPKQEASLEYKSIAKGLMLNKIDKSNLIYPEFSETDEPVELEAYIRDLETIMEKYEPHCSGDADVLPYDLINDVRGLGLFAMLIPQKYGGLTLNGRKFTEKDYARVYESLAENLSLYTVLTVHDLVVSAILKFGSEEQKLKYLPKLASGEMIAAFCLMEEKSGLDYAGSETTYQKDSSRKFAKLNGVKSWVTNGKDADLLLVFAKAQAQGSFSEELMPMTAFLVDRSEINPQEIVLEKRRGSLGLKAAQCWDLKFKDAKIPLTNMLSSEMVGFEMARSVMEDYRYTVGALAAGYLKKSITNVAKKGNAEKRVEEVLCENPSFKRRVYNLSIKAFALESMVYYVAGKRDEFKSKELGLESLCISRFAKKALVEGALDVMNLMGAGGLENGKLSDQLKDILTLSFFMGNSDYLTESVGVTAVQTWAEYWAEDVSKMRKSDEGAFRAITRKLSKGSFTRKLTDPFDIKHYIFESAHPSLEGSCRVLEKAMSNMDLVLAEVIEQFGKDIETEPFVLERLSDSVTLLFAMAACISRASRSYCIGLGNSEVDVYMAHSFCFESERKIRQMMEELIDLNINVEEDDVKEKIARAAMLDGENPTTHPLSRNW